MKIFDKILQFFGVATSDPKTIRTPQQFAEGAKIVTKKVDKIIADLQQDIDNQITVSHVNHAYNYPDHDVPLLQAYKGKYEACYIILHKFYQWDESLPDEAFENKARPINWQQIIKQTEFENINQIYIGLQEYAGQKTNPDHNNKYAKILIGYADKTPEFNLPDAGLHDDLNRQKYIQMLKKHDNTSFIYIPEIPHDNVPSLEWDVTTIDKLKVQENFDWHWVDKSKMVNFTNLTQTEFPYRGTALSSDLNLILTTNWDSYFTLLYGSRKELEATVKQAKFEGFFTNEKTMQAWYLD